jgi:hypothetical protein
MAFSAAIDFGVMHETCVDAVAFTFPSPYLLYPGGVVYQVRH